MHNNIDTGKAIRDILCNTQKNQYQYVVAKYHETCCSMNSNYNSIIYSFGFSCLAFSVGANGWMRNLPAVYVSLRSVIRD